MLSEFFTVHSGRRDSLHASFSRSITIFSTSTVSLSSCCLIQTLCCNRSQDQLIDHRQSDAECNLKLPTAADNQEYWATVILGLAEEPWAETTANEKYKWESYTHSLNCSMFQVNPVSLAVDDSHRLQAWPQIANLE